MAHQLNFDIRYKYDSIASGITVEVLLRLGESIVVTQGKVDPGRKFVSFNVSLRKSLESMSRMAIVMKLRLWQVL
jgi:hypothetical protein